MAIVTNQQIARYYDEYRETEVTFTKDVIHTLAMDPRQIYIKCNGSQWPCIINSTSLSASKIIIGTTGGAFQQIAKKDAPPVSLRFGFYQADGQLMSFFISGKVANVAPYMGKTDLMIVTIQFTQRPPEDLVEKIGILLDAKHNAVRRKDERVLMTPEIGRKMNLSHLECNISVQNVPRRCVLQDLSFVGTKVIMFGLAQYTQNKECELSLEFEEPHEEIKVKGIIGATMLVQGRKDVFVADIKFAGDTPDAFKIRFNAYLSTLRKVDSAPTSQFVPEEDDDEGAI